MKYSNMEPLLLEFDNNRLLPILFGQFNRNLLKFEKAFNVELSTKGNIVAIRGKEDDAQRVSDILQCLYKKLEAEGAMDAQAVDTLIRMSKEAPQESSGHLGEAMGLAIVTHRKKIPPRSLTQSAYIQALRRRELIFAIGPAGTGKTYLAVAMGVEMMLRGDVDRLILSRPAVEAGERLGFLPGDIREKVDPYLRPLYDSLHDMMPKPMVDKKMSSGEIEIAPLAYMRGRTLTNAFIILDEAQNTTPVQMKMFLTRMGHNARMVVTGDMSQMDLPPGTPSGLHDALAALKGIDDIACLRFDENDVVRHPLVTKIIRAYEAHDTLLKS